MIIFYYWDSLVFLGFLGFTGNLPSFRIILFGLFPEGFQYVGSSFLGDGKLHEDTPLIVLVLTKLGQPLESGRWWRYRHSFVLVHGVVESFFDFEL